MHKGHKENRQQLTSSQELGAARFEDGSADLKDLLIQLKKGRKYKHQRTYLMLELSIEIASLRISKTDEVILVCKVM